MVNFPPFSFSTPFFSPRWIWFSLLLLFIAFVLSCVSMDFYLMWRIHNELWIEYLKDGVGDSLISQPQEGKKKGTENENRGKKRALKFRVLLLSLARLKKKYRHKENFFLFILRWWLRFCGSISSGSLDKEENFFYLLFYFLF